MAGYSFPRAVFLLALLPLLAPVVLATGVVIGPDSIVDRGAISLSYTNVTNGTRLSTNMTAAFSPAVGVTWLNLTNWNYPFALRQGRVMVTGQNVNQLLLLVRVGGTFLTRRDTGTGNISVEIPMDFQPYTFHDIRVGYEVHSTKAPLVLTIVQQGFKDGQVEDANITPSVIGAAGGNLTVSAAANNTVLGTKVIRVLSAIPTPPPVSTTATPAAETTAPATATPVETTPATAGSTPAPEITSPATSRTTAVPAITVAAPPGATETPGNPAEDTGLSPFILVYVATIILVAVVADYLLLKD